MTLMSKHQTRAHSIFDYHRRTYESKFIFRWPYAAFSSWNITLIANRTHECLHTVHMCKPVCIPTIHQTENYWHSTHHKLFSCLIYIYAHKTTCTDDNGFTFTLAFCYQLMIECPSMCTHALHVCNFTRNIHETSQIHQNLLH